MTETNTTPLYVKHTTLLNRPPSEKQLNLYNKFPFFRGFSDSSLDVEILEAVIVLGLLDGTFNEKVLILTPPDQEGWVLQRLEYFADTVFEEAKKYPNASKIAQGYGILFKKLRLATRVLQLPSEPDHWVSFGFSTYHPIPDWMKFKLLDLPYSIVKNSPQSESLYLD